MSIIKQQQETETMLAVLRGQKGWTEMAKKRGKGHWGHRGRKGKRGGSLPKGAGGVTAKRRPLWASDVTPADARKRQSPPGGPRMVEGWDYAETGKGEMIERRVGNKVAAVNVDKYGFAGKWRATRGVVGKHPKKFGGDVIEEQRFSKWGDAFAYADNYL